MQEKVLMTSAIQCKFIWTNDIALQISFSHFIYHVISKAAKYINWSMIINYNTNHEIITSHSFLFRYADQVSIGDEILLLRNNELASMKVISVSKLTLQGKCCQFSNMSYKYFQIILSLYDLLASLDSSSWISISYKW